MWSESSRFRRRPEALETPPATKLLQADALLHHPPLSHFARARAARVEKLDVRLPACPPPGRRRASPANQSRAHTTRVLT